MIAHFRRGKRISLRPLEITDQERCVRWFNDEQITRFLIVGAFPLNQVREEEFLRNLYQSQQDVPLAICLPEGEHIGICGLHRIDPVSRHAELGIVIGEAEQHGRGYGTEAVALLLTYAFETLNLQRVELQVDEDNAAGLRCYRRLGFTEEGRRRAAHYIGGRYHDLLLFGMLRDEWTGIAGKAAP